MNKDIHRIGSLVSGVNRLVEMGIMDQLTSRPIVFVETAVLQKKDKTYMMNWCRNILRVWALTNAQKVMEMGGIEYIVLKIHSKTDGRLVCQYSESEGFLNS